MHLGNIIGVVVAMGAVVVAMVTGAAVRPSSTPPALCPGGRQGCPDFCNLNTRVRALRAAHADCKTPDFEDPITDPVMRAALSPDSGCTLPLDQRLRVSSRLMRSLFRYYRKSRNGRRFKRLIRHVQRALDHVQANVSRECRAPEPSALLPACQVPSDAELSGLRLDNESHADVWSFSLARLLQTVLDKLASEQGGNLCARAKRHTLSKSRKGRRGKNRGRKAKKAKKAKKARKGKGKCNKRCRRKQRKARRKQRKLRAKLQQRTSGV